MAACEPSYGVVCPVSLVIDSAGCAAAFGGAGSGAALLAGILPNTANADIHIQAETGAAPAPAASNASAFVVSCECVGLGVQCWVNVFALSEGASAGAGQGSGSLALLGSFNTTGAAGNPNTGDEPPATAALDPYNQVVYVTVARVVYAYDIASGKARTVYTCSDGAPEAAAVPWGGGSCTGITFDHSRRSLLLLAAGGISILADSGFGVKLTPVVAAVSLLVSPGYTPTFSEPKAFFQKALQPWTVAVDGATGAAYSMISQPSYSGDSATGFDLFELRYSAP